MSTIGLRKNGKAIGIDPNDPTHAVYANRDVVGLWEAVTVTEHQGYVDVLIIAANQQLCITPDGQLEPRPAGAIGSWEQLQISTDRKTISRAGVVLTIDGEFSAPATRLHLERRGNDFIDANGQRMVIPACDMFLAFRQFRDGGPDALAPFIVESNRLGFTAWRVFMQGSKAQNQVFDLSPRETGYYGDVRPFADHLNAHGLIPIVTAYVDNQDVRSSLGHWRELGDRLDGSASLLSGGNQWSKNGFDPYALPDPGHGIIWSRGSDVEDTITDPRGAPASELHATRNSFDRALMDATASPPFMRSKGAGMVWMSEGAPFGDASGYSEQQAWKLGRAYSIEWSLAVMHNRASQRGLLMNDEIARCAAAWVRGMKL